MKNKTDVNFLLKNKSSWENKAPCFVINKKKLNSNIKSFKKFFNGEVAYSLKTNPDPCILKKLMKNGCSLLISSIEELGEVVKFHDFSASKIIFQSPSLTYEQYKITRKLGIHRYSIDSYDQLEIVLKDIKSNSAELELLVRINTGVKIKNPELPYGMDSYLGFPLKEAKKVLIKLNSLKGRGVKRIGVHNHLLSQNTFLNLWEENLNTITKFLVELKSKGLEIDVVNLGGGYPIEYHKSVPSLLQISRLINNFKKKISEIYPEMHYVFEPGRKLVAEAVTLIAKVVHTKKFLDSNVAILNCSLYNCSLDTLIVDLYLPVEKIQAKGNKSEKLKNYVIRGSTPDSLDIFAKDVRMAELKNGDHVAFLRCGAYSFGCDFISLKKAHCVEI
jgi:ornithine decarboxylase